MSKDFNINAADQLLGEYLIYRGFTQSFRSLESERAKDKTKLFDSSKIVESIFAYLNGYEIESFISLWDFLSKRFFFHLDGEHLGYSIFLKSDLMKYYLVHAMKSNRKDKLTEFFTMYSHEILAEGGDQLAAGLRGWYVLPFMDEPEKDNEFAVYFTTRWSDTLRNTLGNFLSLVMAAAPPPRLLMMEKWFHSAAQTEMRSQLSSSARKVDVLVAKLEKAEERINALRSCVRDLAVFVQKSAASNSVSSGSSHGNQSGGGSGGRNGGDGNNEGGSGGRRASHLFDNDEEVDFKRDKARKIGQAVVKSATEIVHKTAHIASMSREVRLKEILGDSAALFFHANRPSTTSTTATTQNYSNNNNNAHNATAGFTSFEDTKGGSSFINLAEAESDLVLMINQWLKNLTAC